MLRSLVIALKDKYLLSTWRNKGVEFGSGIKIYGISPLLKVLGPLTIGTGCVFRGGHLRSFLEVRPNGRLAIGARTFINKGVEIQSEISVTIGEGCLIGDEVIIQDTTFHEVDEGGSPKIAPVVIGNNVWIARRAIILPGVTIGDHAVVGAGSVVTRDVAPKTVVAGSPARLVRDVQASDSFRR